MLGVRLWQRYRSSKPSDAPTALVCIAFEGQILLSYGIDTGDP